MPDPKSGRSTAKPLSKALSGLKRTGQVLKQLSPHVVPPQEAAATFKERRVARRQPSGLSLTLADHIDGLNGELWDRLAHQTLFLSRDYLRVLEAHAPSNLTPRYALVLHAGEPVAIMLFQRLTVDGERLRKPGRQGLLSKPLERLEEHLLVCGNVLVWGPRGLAFAPDADEATLWHAVGEALYRLRRADKLLGESDLAMIKDFSGDSDAAPKALRLLGYRHVDTEPDMVLQVRADWRSFDDYLGSLTSSYRSGAKKLLKDCAAAGIQLRDISAQEMKARQDELHGLYRQVHEAQGLRLATLQPSYLPAMAQALGPRFACRVAERDGRLQGFVTAVHDGDTTLGYYVGYDRATNAEAPVYLTLLQSTVEDAICFGSSRLSLGRTALEPKAKMGCQPVPLACGVRHRVSALNWLVSALTKTATHEEPPQRSPFKVDKSASTPT
ncbi:MAG: GNAT family N-acetyltransferase [Ideonella sp. MAG2]|nr:MAG: GNAT family N-acetyltransferase [Ideonella sp. MAG2]